MRHALLWTVVFLGPLIWFLNLNTNFALAPLVCTGQGISSTYLMAILSLIVSAVSAALLWTRFRVTAPEGPVRGIAITGAALNVFVFLVILAQFIPVLMMSGCE